VSEHKSLVFWLVCYRTLASVLCAGLLLSAEFTGRSEISKGIHLYA
jgi:hypothetical protein